MNYIVFGCGKTGKDAFAFLSPARIAYYADNYKSGESLYGKSVISYSEMIKICEKDEETIVVIASDKCCMEMEKQIQESDIIRYFVFHESDIYLMKDILPYYFLFRKEIKLSYTQILSHWSISQYKHIAIYGVNHFLPYLITEIMEQVSKAKISIISQEGYKEKIYSLGYPVFNSIECLSEEERGFDCVLLNVRQNEDDIRERILNLGCQIRVLDIYGVTDIEPAFYHKELEIYKDIHRGKRIFVVGNGPSLRFEDLDKLHEHGEICIAFNKIYKAYDRTKWRADYIGLTDHRIIEVCSKDILKVPGKVFIADRYHTGGSSYIKGVQYYHEFVEEFYPNYPQFSNDFATGFYNGMTVAYDIGLQLAAYMGASEIYLLGIDNSMTGNITNEENHFLSNYYSEEEKCIYEGLKFEQQKLVKAYEKAEIYSRHHGFRIFNATRGGKLEVYERVDFDSLFKG